MQNNKKRKNPKASGNLRMDLNEFAEQGYVQEINRRFLHPLGLNLVVNLNAEDDEPNMYILDNRDQRDRLRVFSFGITDIKDKELLRKLKSKKDYIDSEFARIGKLRAETIGSDIEVIPEL